MNADDLRPLFLFDGLSDDKLAALAAVGEDCNFRAGEELFHEGDPADHFWVLLDGRVDLVRRAGREEPVVMMTMDRPGLWAGGFRAWNNESSYLATGRGATDGRILRVDSQALRALGEAWFPFALHLIEGFFQTVRSMDSLSRQRESLIALGTLAAGLAHEMNNPAAATARAADALNDTCDELLGSLTRLAEASLTSERFIDLDKLRRDIEPSIGPVDPLALADLEERLMSWLEDRGVTNGWRIAPALAAAGVDVEWCERVAAVLDDATLEPGIEWVAGTVATHALLSEVKESTARISALVDAVKSYSQLDRASAQLIDVTDGIESTLVMLAHKYDGGLQIVREYSPELPRIEANPAELNQVWTNLIDNAIDAVNGAGTLTLRTRVEPGAVVIEVGDTGPGMSAEVRARAFEPFFTTKDVGKGTGLGLDISRRIIVDRHHGAIAIDSSPAGTVVRVRLPRSPDR
jgi:signal transduction histidine kinase